MKKLTDWLSKNRGKSIAAVVVLVLWLTLEMTLLAPPPWKVIDPIDPRFNPDAFSFSDYHGREELTEAFRKLFPVGTPKDFVDKVLITAGNAKFTWNKNFQSTSIKLAHYVYLPFYTVGRANHLFWYDNKNKLLNIQPYGADGLYANQPMIDGEDKSYDNP